METRFNTPKLRSIRSDFERFEFKSSLWCARPVANLMLCHLNNIPIPRILRRPFLVHVLTRWSKFHILFNVTGEFIYKHISSCINKSIITFICKYRMYMYMRRGQIKSFYLELPRLRHILDDGIEVYHVTILIVNDALQTRITTTGSISFR